MPEGHVLEFTGVTKRFGPVTAVDGFSARVEPGVVTGFLGPNGAGKTTSLRILLGLISATGGTATIGGKRYAQLKHPLQTVGAALEASSFHPGRSAANHLKVYAHAAGIPASRVDDALGTVGLADVAGRKVGGFSLGMRQRLGLAYTLLGDPGVLVLDEPSNGLDPEGIKWMRGFLRELARQGRTVLVSSHMLAEIQQTAQSLLIIARGRLMFQGTLGDLTEQEEYATVVDSPDRAALSAALSAAELPFEMLRTGFTVRGADTATIGAVAAAAGVALSSLQRRGPALEEVFLDLVNGVRVHASATAGPADHAIEEQPAALPPLDTGEAPAETPDDAQEQADLAQQAPPGAAEDETTAEEGAADEVAVDEHAGAAESADKEPPAVDDIAADSDAPDETVTETDAEVDSDVEDAETPVTWDADHSTTEADVEADRFFSQYDATPEDEEVDSEVEPEDGEVEPEDGEVEPEPEVEIEPEVEPSEPVSDPESAGEAEPAPAPDGDADPEPDGDTEADTPRDDEGGEQR